MTKPLERAQARQLRSDGMSVKDIAMMLGVTKSSVSVWVRDITLTDEQIAALRDKYHHYEARIRGSQANYQKGLQQRITYQQEGRAKARENDPLHLAGCMLYWAEGAKSRDSLKFVNSDPHMLQFYVKFLCEALLVIDVEIVIRINCYTNNGLTVEQIEDYWLDTLRLPRGCLRKTTVNNQPISSKQRGRRLIYGVCALTVYQTRLVQHVLGAIQEYTGIDKPEWLL
jgi:predicted transcriptional regulator